MSGILLYEDSISFDSDDPDFGDKTEYDEREDNDDDRESSALHQSFSNDCLQSTMSCGGVIHSNASCYSQNWLTRSESAESFDSRLGSMLPNNSPDNLITIEDLKSQFNSCYTCGVSWSDNHVSLDCKECGSYSLSRPCMLCDGKCSTVWQRNIDQSHNTRKAQWDGECTLSERDRPPVSSFLPEDVLIQGLEDLSTSS